MIKIMYKSTLAVSNDKQATCSQILPIMTKLESHFKIAKDDSPFVATIKKKVWDDLSRRYQVQNQKINPNIIIPIHT